MKHFILTFLCLSWLLIPANGNNRVISVESLLQEMINRDQLSQYPEPFYVNKQFSSYDRATTDPSEQSWFANWDRSMFIRVDNTKGRKEYVMMDAEGPGAIVRFWMTFASPDCGKGTLRIYIDNSTEPVIEGSALDVISGGKLAGVPLSTSVSDLTSYAMRGHNLYLPIPYKKHCKVTYESSNIKDFGAKTGGEAVYYNINYRTYEAGTKVVSFSKRELQKCQQVLANVQKQLQQRTVVLPDNVNKTTLKGTLAPSQSIFQKIENNNSAIRKVSFTINSTNKEQALRSTILSISFDGYKTVECPLGDFFGTGYQVRPSNTWYTHVDAEGTLSCYWIMPYKKECIVSLENRSNDVVTVTNGEITTAPYQWDQNTMYFGTSWRQYTNLSTGEFKNNEGGGYPFDINYVNLQGKGVYVGDGITLFNTRDAWWGEGDEKVYIDGEQFPSHIGTGTEDYYGYAWCRPERFSNHPFIAQPDGSGNFHPGYTVNLRFRNLDAIPFKTSLKFDMEMWHWVNAVINFAPVTYWYIAPENAMQSPSMLEEATKPVVTKLEQMPQTAQWYKGNTHTHSTYSDGDTSAQDVIEWYRSHNYNFLFVTDHNYPLQPDSIYNSPNNRFILIPGDEVSDIRAIHSSALNTKCDIPYVAGYKNKIKNNELPASLLDSLPQTTADVVDLHTTQILKNGGLPILNHPNFLSGVHAKDIISVRKLKHMEVFNGHPLVYNDGNDKHAPVEVKWDSVLTHKHLIYGVASDDAHHFQKWGKDKANPGRGWIMVNAKDLNANNIVQAIRRGEFYASTGVILADYRHNKQENSLLITVDPDKTAGEIQVPKETLTFKIEFIGYNGKVLYETTGLQAMYTGQKADKYMRVKVTCQANGQTYAAWGQPIELEKDFFND